MRRLGTDRRRTFNLRAHLLEYLEERAAVNYRHVDAELNAILDTLCAARNPPTVPGKLSQEASFTRGPLRTASGYRGVYPYGKRWVARIYEDGQTVKLSVTDTPKEAAEAYDAYVRARSPGGIATTPVNFPTGDESGVTTEDDSYDPYTCLPLDQQETVKAAFHNPDLVPEVVEDRNGLIELPNYDDVT